MRHIINSHKVDDGHHFYRVVRKHRGKQLDVRLMLTKEEYDDRELRKSALIQLRKEITDHRNAHEIRI